MSNEEPFLARWSRLKREEADKAAETEKDTKPSEARPVEEQEPLDLAKLPRLEDLTANTDMRVFLDPRVPAELRNEALRRAWRLDPVIDSFIEVAENQYDWNTPGGAPGFGPLVAGSDLPSLLAQATGRLLGPAAEPVRAVALEVDAPSMIEAAAPAVERDVAPQKADERRYSVADVDVGGTAESPACDQDAEARPALRKRHGSALPQ